jgi:GT2 family glycosyltransferase
MLYEHGDTIWCAGGHISIASGFTRLTDKGRDRRIYAGAAPFETEFVAGACLLISTDAVSAVGLLDDEYFAYYEDVDWCFRLRRLGLRSYTVPKSVIRHKKSASTGASGTNQLSAIAAYFIARNAFVFARGNLTGIRRVIFRLAQLLVRAPYNLLFRTRSGSRRAYLDGLWDGVAHRSARAPTR